MSAAKKSKGSSLLVPDWLVMLAKYLVGPGRTLALLGLVAAVFLIGWFLIWRHVQQRIIASGEYAVTLDKVDVTPPPDWIRHTDIRREVFRNASLEGSLSILDDDLADRIYNAFASHPWVAKVRKVTKHAPDRITVELVYRCPACMVEVPGDLRPVDAEGVLLPGEEFSPIAKQSYPRLNGISTLPVGPIGQPWGDVRVVEGAEIAAALGPKWQTLKLDRIAPVATGGPQAGGANVYELVTRGGTRIVWGFAPGAKAVGEPSASEKVTRLLQYLADHGPLDGRDGPQRLDVRALPRGK
jgi:hypothetical protein